MVRFILLPVKYQDQVQGARDPFGEAPSRKRAGVVSHEQLSPTVGSTFWVN